MTSDRPDTKAPEEAYVWIWLPGATEPVVAGRIARDGERLIFNYGQSYLDRPEAIPIFEPELPLRSGAIAPEAGLSMAGCLRDAAPDAWGRRVILNRAFGRKGQDVDIAVLDELTYLLASGSDRIGALDFQRSPSEYQARAVQNATLEELLNAAEKVERGVPLTPDLDQALFHGTSLGGARPKAMVQDGDTKMIAKFSSSTDTYNVVKAEYVAMRLAAKAGLNVAPVRLEWVAGKDVLLVERFDRTKTNGDWTRKAMVSALTLFGLDEMMARYASYEDFAEIIRHRFTSPRATLHELYGRLVFNILCGNTDDHARNHAGFWDGKQLTLTPAYDICPQSRSGNVASQAMLIVGNNRTSTLATCLEAAPNFQLGDQAAKDIITRQIGIIRNGWDDICDEADLNEVERNLFGKRIFLNEFAFEGAPEGLQQA
ncbi:MULTISPECIES: type II toxin-antitoxin system HipA family toxin [unclassified Wenzhouxiangella]|uniref:type II toxin-antitoxin system HipA family toxin n=1 Tax=unclassified Wenzhouxiangella TaxID=2613841 RepID=UPI000E326137|nr:MULTISPECIES: type II toxin-antitoxin system HipA family toxin [unclassified Wenzhouxiangella]RFF28929.1 type II toxin-antitoxin system HipA family toxin [Wenzhouxiangella sp. 15181]RFP69056.1 type II toxin-antitoxin system HipA family toxin [Wenzhouxiangella sp. 15190]